VGLVSHIDNVNVDEVVNTPQLATSALNNIQDLIRALGFFSTGGNNVTGLAASMTIRKAAGTGFALNENANVNPKDPHNFAMPLLSPATMLHILRDASVISTSATIDPTQYDGGAGLVPVPANNNATISYIYAFPNNSIVYLFGQEVFDTFAEAKDAAGTESIVLPSDLAEGGLLLARVVLKKSATDITDTSESCIIPSSSISSGGAALTALQQAYDISVQPEIKTNATGGAVSFEQGSGSDNDDVIEVRNGAGSQTFSVDGNGNVTLNNKTGIDSTLVSGTAGVDGNLLRWNGDGDAIDSGIAAGDISLNTTHRSSDGSDHSFIDQDVTSGSSPTFLGTNISAIPNGALSTNPLNRANHTGTQLSTTIGDFAARVGDSVSALTNKTFDANGVGNSISNINVDEIESGSSILHGGVTFNLDGDGADIPLGTADGRVDILADCFIESYKITVIGSGNITIITGSTPPTLSSGNVVEVTNLADWGASRQLIKGDSLFFNIDACTGITYAQITLRTRITQ
jgi:hypothetical protein